MKRVVSKPKSKPDPKPDRLKVKDNWRQAIKQSLAKRTPSEGWPK
jgi:hypothetical protein